MDKATIHRLMVICKSHYVLRTIDDLFILAGADLEWCIKRVAPQGKSEREDRFNCWVYGIRYQAPQREDAILWKVAGEVVRNPDVPEQQHQALNEVLANAARIEVSDNGFQLEPFLATLARMLASAGLTREVAIVTFAESVLALLENSYGEEYYVLHLHVPHRLYIQIEAERKRCEKIFPIGWMTY